jgi:hypothetical protein
MASGHDGGRSQGIDAWPSAFREQRPLGTVYPPAESQYSAELHDQVVIAAWEGTPIGVDVEMAPLLAGLWQEGYRTYFSCQGDPGGPCGTCGGSGVVPAPGCPCGSLVHATSLGCQMRACPECADAQASPGLWAYIDFETPEMALRFVADFHLAGLADCRAGDSVVRFPAGSVQELRRELTRRGALTHWEDIRDIALRVVGELETMFAAGHPAVTEAAMAARGYNPVTIAHGTPETSEEEGLMRGLAETAAECGHLAAIRGGNEHTTYLFAGPDGSTAAAAFIARVTQAAPRWWRVTPTAYPHWHPGM